MSNDNDHLYKASDSDWLLMCQVNMLEYSLMLYEYSIPVKNIDKATEP
jgi:hypothetical protein